MMGLKTDFGHDKSRAIKPYAAMPADHRPILVYCGDGVSDISAARETDLLFAKKGRDLVTHCLQENVPFYPFDVGASILPHLPLPSSYELGFNRRRSRKSMPSSRTWKAARRQLPKSSNKVEFWRKVFQVVTKA